MCFLQVDLLLPFLLFCPSFHSCRLTRGHLGFPRSIYSYEDGTWCLDGDCGGLRRLQQAQQALPGYIAPTDTPSTTSSSFGSVTPCTGCACGGAAFCMTMFTELEACPDGTPPDSCP